LLYNNKDKIIYNNMAKKFIRKLTRVGKYSYSLTLPAKVIKKWGWRERQKLSIEIKERAKKIIVKDYNPSKKRG